MNSIECCCFSFCHRIIKHAFEAQCGHDITNSIQWQAKIGILSMLMGSLGDPDREKKEIRFKVVIGSVN